MNFGGHRILQLSEFVGTNPEEALAIIQSDWHDYVAMFSTHEVVAAAQFLKQESALFSEWQDFVRARREYEPFRGYFNDGSLYIRDLDGDYMIYLSSNNKVRRLELWAQQYCLSRKRVATPGCSSNYIEPLSMQPRRT